METTNATTAEKNCSRNKTMKYAVVEMNVYHRGEKKVLHTFADEQEAWNRVRRLTVEKGGGGWYYSVEVQG